MGGSTACAKALWWKEPRPSVSNTEKDPCDWSAEMQGEIGGEEGEVGTQGL